MFYNNMGCIHYNLKKYKAASFYFSKALTLNQMLYEEGDSQISLNNFSKDKQCEILYNLGLSLLYTNKYILAFECLKKASYINYKNTGLWMRISECCLAFCAQQIKDSKKLFKDYLGVRFLSQERKRVILPTVDYENAFFPFVGINNHNQSESNSELQEISLDCALSSLRNVILCLNSEEQENNESDFNENDTIKDSQLHSKKNIKTNNIEENFESLSKNQELKHIVFLNIAYIMLLRRDALSALFYSKQVLDCSQSDAQSFVADLYAAEAYCLLNDIDSALNHLNAATNNPSFGESESSNKQSSSKQFSIPFKRILYTNMISVYISKGNFEKAKQFLLQAMSISSAPTIELLLLDAYLNLIQGDLGKTLEILRRGRPLPKKSKSKTKKNQKK